MFAEVFRLGDFAPIFTVMQDKVIPKVHGYAVTSYERYHLILC